MGGIWTGAIAATGAKSMSTRLETEYECHRHQRVARTYACVTSLAQQVIVNTPASYTGHVIVILTRHYSSYVTVMSYI